MDSIKLHLHLENNLYSEYIRLMANTTTILVSFSHLLNVLL